MQGEGELLSRSSPSPCIIHISFLLHRDCLFSGGDDIGGGESVCLEEGGDGARMAVGIVHTDADDGSGSGLANDLSNCRAETADDIMLLSGDDRTCIGNSLSKEIFWVFICAQTYRLCAYFVLFKSNLASVPPCLGSS